MYFNVISFKNGKTVSFTSELPYSVDKLTDDWNLVTIDSEPKQIISFKGSEVVAIVSQIVPKDDNSKQKRAAGKKKPAIKTAVKTE